MCGVQRPGYNVPSSPMIDTTENTATFYYIEGLKATQIYDDAVRAARLFGRAMEIDSTHSPSYFAAANNMALHDLPRALAYSRTANRLDSVNEWYRTQLARLLVMSEKYDEALGEYQRLLRAAPSNPENYTMLAALYDFRRQPFSALALLDSAEVRFGRMEAIGGFRRDIYMRLNMLDHAIEESLAMIAEFPYDYENYLIAGDLYLATGRDSLSRAYLLKASALNPDAPEVLASMANYYRTSGDMAGFFASLRRLFRNKSFDVRDKAMILRDITRDRPFFGANYLAASELALLLRAEHPNDYDVLNLYVTTLLANGQTDEALSVYKSCLSDTVSIVAPFISIIDGEAFLGRADSVDKYSLMAIRRFPDNAELYIRRGSALSYMGRDREALRVYRRALRVAATDSLRSAVHGITGDMHHKAGRDRRAFASYDRALRLDPDNVHVLNNYAYFLSLRKERLDRALEMASRVIELEPGNPTYIDTYGWVLFKMGRLEEARVALQRAVSLDRRGSGELFIHYGDVLHALGDMFMARFYWGKALEAGHDAEEINARMATTAEK